MPDEDLQSLPTPDPTIDSKNPLVLANLATLATMGAPAFPDGVTFIDMNLVSPIGTSPLHAVIFHAKVNGEWVEHVSLDYLLASFPFVVYNELLSKKMITPGPGTPNMPVFQTEPSSDAPMKYDPHKLPGGTKNPGDFGTLITGGVVTLGPLTSPINITAQGSQGIFGKL